MPVATQNERNEIMAENNLSFENLMNSIKEINSKAGSMAKRSVNQLMTLRNWAIGYFRKRIKRNTFSRVQAVLFNLSTNSFDSVE